MASKKEVELELRLVKQSKRIEAIVTIVKEIIRCGTIIFVAWMVYLSTQALAGQTTAAEIGIKVLGNVKINAILGWVAGGGGVVYGLAQRKLRFRTIRRMADRVSDAERELDEKRTSSRLAEHGGTHPQDAFGVETP